MNVLGFNSFFEHPSVALISNGELIFAIEDERFTGVKHGKKYTPYKAYVPFDSMYHALKYTGLKISEIDEIAYSYSSSLHLRSLYGCLTGSRLSSLREEWAAYKTVRNTKIALHSNFEVPLKYREILDTAMISRIPYREWGHHLSHAASVFYCSGFLDSLIIVADGSGENDCTSVYVAKEKTIRRIAKIPLPHSLGLYYSFITKHLGFEPFSDEFKVMGLSAYGKPRFQKEMAEFLTPDHKGGYKLSIKHLLHLNRLLGDERTPGKPITDIYLDIACSAQKHLEETIESLVTYYLRETKMRTLCLAGGTFLNCVSNGKLFSNKFVEKVFVQPAAHDAGTAIGAAALSSISRGGKVQLSYNSMFLGTSYSNNEIEAILKDSKCNYGKVDDAGLIQLIATRLYQGHIGCLFRGRMEFGPRSLGNRSIIASPSAPAILQKINSLKGREQFRPLAPIVTEEAFATYFEGYPNRYMSFTVSVKEEVRNIIPAVTHVDGTARAQVVAYKDDPFLHQLLTAFSSSSGFPVLINTSLNVRGKPIVEHPIEALGLLFSHGFDFLVLENFFISNNEQKI